MPLTSVRSLFLMLFSFVLVDIILSCIFVEMKARKFNSEVIKTIVSVTSRRDKIGRDFFICEFDSPSLGKSYISFSEFSSVIDFIKSNF